MAGGSSSRRRNDGRSGGKAKASAQRPLCPPATARPVGLTVFPPATCLVPECGTPCPSGCRPPSLPVATGPEEVLMSSPVPEAPSRARLTAPPPCCSCTRASTCQRQCECRNAGDSCFSCLPSRDVKKKGWGCTNRQYRVDELPPRSSRINAHFSPPEGGRLADPDIPLALFPPVGDTVVDRTHAGASPYARPP